MAAISGGDSLNMNSLKLVTFVSALLASSLHLAAASDHSATVPARTANNVPAIDLASALEKLNADLEMRLQLDIDATVHGLRTSLEDKVEVALPRTLSTPVGETDVITPHIPEAAEMMRPVITVGSSGS